MQTIDLAQNLVQNTSRGPSDGLWKDCPVLEFIENPERGMYFWEDFGGFPDNAVGSTGTQQNIGQWATWIGANASAAIGTKADTTNLPVEGGVAGITGGTTAIDVTLAAGLPMFRFVTNATGNAIAGGKLWLEARIAVSTVATANLDLFVGLADAGWSGTHITSAASSFFSATNTLLTQAGNGGLLGFWKRATSNPTDVAVAFNVNNGTVQTPGSTSTLQKMLANSGFAGLTSGLTAYTATNQVPAANTFVKLGMLFDPTAACPIRTATSAVTSNQTVGTAYSARVQFFINGQVLPWFLNTADVVSTLFPNTYLVPVIAYRSGGTAAGIGYVDWLRVAQQSFS